MKNFKVEVKYNSYLDGIEIGALSCDSFTDVLDFAEHVTFTRKFVEHQMKYDALYRDIHEARLDVHVNGQRLATLHYRRSSIDSNEIQVSGSYALV